MELPSRTTISIHFTPFVAPRCSLDAPMKLGQNLNDSTHIVLFSISLFFIFFFFLFFSFSCSTIPHLPIMLDMHSFLFFERNLMSLLPPHHPPYQDILTLKSSHSPLPPRLAVQFPSSLRAISGVPSICPRQHLRLLLGDYSQRNETQVLTVKNRINDNDNIKRYFMTVQHTHLTNQLSCSCTHHCQIILFTHSTYTNVLFFYFFLIYISQNSLKIDQISFHLKWLGSSVSQFPATDDP